MKKLTTLIFIFCFAIVGYRFAMTSHPYAGTTYYVSTSGSDANNGTSSATPWQTLSKVNSMMSSFAPGDVISLNKGDVFVGSLIITKAGASGNPITYTAYGSGANPIISGFNDVTAWTNTGGNIWRSTSAASTLTYVNVVSVGGVNTPMGRTPNAGSYYAITSATGHATVTLSGLPSSPNLTGAEYISSTSASWVKSRNIITSHSGSTLNTAINYILPSGYPAYNYSNRGFIQNALSTLDAANEWYFDKSTKQISIYSTSAPTGVKVTTVDSLVKISAAFITINGIDFQGANTDAIQLVGASNNATIQNCNFRYVGDMGVQVLNNTSPNATITGNTFTDVMNSAITDIYTNSNSNWTVTSNTITNCNMVEGQMGSVDGQNMGICLSADNGTGQLIQYNSIDNCGYIGIGSYGQSYNVRNNLVNHYCTYNTDGGGIYTGNHGTSRFIVGNIVLNGMSGQAQGIYVDDNGSNVFIWDNTVYNAGANGIYLHNAHEIEVRRNTVWRCPVSSFNMGHDANDLTRNTTIRANKFILAATNTNQGNCAYGTSENSENNFGTSDSNYIACPVVSDNNAWFTARQGTTFVHYTLAQAQANPPGIEGTHSKKSPRIVPSVDSVRFEYNATSSSVPVSLGSTAYIDITGQAYSTSITLPAWGSAVLIRTGTGTANTLPVASAGPDQVKTLPTNSATMAGSGTDADGTISSYKWTKVSGPATFTITNDASPTTTITGLVQGVYQFQLEVTDNNGGKGVDVMQVTVNAAANTPPTGTAGLDQAITLPTNTATLTGSGSDAEGPVTFQWTQIGTTPSAATIVSSTQAKTVVNNLGVSGTYQFQLKITDNSGAFITDNVNVVVSPATNTPPQANAGPDQTITGTSATVTGTSSDPGGSIASVQWSVESVPIGATNPTFTAATSNTTGVSGMTTPGSYTLRYTATDNLGASSFDFVVIQKTGAANTAPTANAGLDQTITLPTNSVNVSGAGSSDAESAITYLWTRLSGPTTFNIVAASQQNTQIINLVQGVYVFDLKVTDAGGLTAHDQVQITVNAPANNPPIVTIPGGNITITQPANSTIVTASPSDPGGSISSVQWTVEGKPAGASDPTFTAATSNTTTVNNLVTPGTYTLRFTATDNLGATNFALVTIQVNISANIPPTANAGNDQTDTLPVSQIALSGGGTDADGTIKTYKWTLFSGPGTVLINSPTQKNTTVTGFSVPGDYTFRLTVTDDRGGAATDDVTVHIIGAVGPPPLINPTANAGPNFKVYLCAFGCGSSASLTVTGIGTAGTYPIASYQWQKISGPSATIVSPNSASTTITGLVRGQYVFQFTVTDTNDASATDTITVTVTRNFLLFNRKVIVIKL